MREFPPSPFYPNEQKSLPANSSVNCKVPLPPGTYPLQRCISNLFAYNLSPYSIEQHSEPKSKRRTSHMVTWFGQYVSFGITSSMNTIPSTPLIIPADDAEFNPPHSIPGELSAKGINHFHLTRPEPCTTELTL